MSSDKACLKTLIDRFILMNGNVLSVRNLLMVPLRRRAQVLKATKLAEVGEVRDKEEKPQGNGGREGG